MDEITLAGLTRMSESELRSAVAELELRLTNLHMDERGELRDLNPAGQRQFDETSALLGRAQRHLSIRQAANGGERARETAGSRHTGLLHNSRDAFDADALKLRDDEARDKALAALDSRSRELSSEQGDQIDGLIRQRITDENPNCDGSYLARRLLITESDEYRHGFQEVTTQTAPMLATEEAAALRAFRSMERAMNEGTSASGGYGIPVTIDPTIVLTAQGSSNAIFNLCRKAQVTSNAWKGVTSSGVTWSFDPEGSAVSDDSPTLAQPVVPVYMARGFIPFSIEVSQDYPGFADECSTLLAEGYSDLASQKLAVGSGTNEPTGLVTALAADATVQVSLATRGTLAATDINHGFERLPERFKDRAAWLMSYGNSDTVASFGNSSNLSFVTVDLTGSLNTLRTKPVYNSPWMMDLTSSTGSSNAVVVGDFSGYLMAQRIGLNVELVNHLFDTTTGRPTGQRGWFAYARFGADAVVHQAFRLINQT